MFPITMRPKRIRYFLRLSEISIYKRIFCYKVTLICNTYMPSMKKNNSLFAVNINAVCICLFIFCVSVRVRAVNILYNLHKQTLISYARKK